LVLPDPKTAEKLLQGKLGAEKVWGVLMLV
jgi:hypothetical protein